jgi:hypothetical protein
MLAGVSKGRNVFVFSVQQSKKRILDPEDEGNTTLRNIGKYRPATQ